MNTPNSAGDLLEQSATFGAMTEGTAMDWKIIAAHNQQLAADVATRVIDHLKLLEGDHGGFAVYRLVVVARGARLAEDVAGTPGLLARVTMRIFDLLLPWTLHRSPWGWQIVGVARNPA